MKILKTGLNFVLALLLGISVWVATAGNVEAVRLNVADFNRLDQIEGVTYLDNYGATDENKKIKNATKYFTGISNDNKYIYGITTLGGYENIKRTENVWSYRLGDKDWNLISTTDHNYHNLFWSKNNKYVAYTEVVESSSGQSQYTTEVKEASGLKGKVVFSSLSSSTKPTISPDEQYVTYMPTEHNQLVVRHLNSGKELNFGDATSSKVLWSPDSKKLYYSQNVGSFAGDTYRIYAYDLGQQKPVLLLEYLLGGSGGSMDLLRVSDSGLIAVSIQTEDSGNLKYGSNLISLNPDTKEVKSVGRQLNIKGRFGHANLSGDFTILHVNDRLYNTSNGNSIFAQGVMSPDGKRFISSYGSTSSNIGHELYDISRIFSGSIRSTEEMTNGQILPQFGKEPGLIVSWDSNPLYSGYEIKKDGNVIGPYQPIEVLIQQSGDKQDLREKATSARRIKIFDKDVQFNKDYTYEITAFHKPGEVAKTITITYKGERKAKLGKNEAALGSKVKVGGKLWILIADNYLISEKSIGQSTYSNKKNDAPKFDNSKVANVISQWINKNFSSLEKKALENKTWNVTDTKTNQLQFSYTGTFGLPSVRDFDNLNVDIRGNEDFMYFRELAEPYKKGTDAKINTSWWSGDYSFGSLTAHGLNVSNTEIRPVIYLKAATVFAGSGTTADPYRITSVK